MKVIGLTGGIGSGKSTVARFLKELGAVVVDADTIGHQAFKPGSTVWEQVVRAFGQQIVADDGTIDRTRLGKLVFNDDAARVKLNRIMHPPMLAMVKARLDRYRRQGASIVVLEAPLLLEAGWQSLVDEVWVTVAEENTVLERTKKRSGLPADEVRARIHSQLSPQERMQSADIVIDTECSLDELKATVRELWARQ